MELDREICGADPARCLVCRFLKVWKIEISSLTVEISFLLFNAGFVTTTGIRCLKSKKETSTVRDEISLPWRGIYLVVGNGRRGLLQSIAYYM